MRDTAVRTWAAAIEERIERRDYQTALQLIRQEVADRGGRLSSGDRLFLRVLEGESLAFLGECQHAASVAREAAASLRKGHDHQLYARACFCLAVAQYYMGNLDEATESVSIALFSFKRAEDYSGVVRSLSRLGNIAFAKGDYRRALVSYQECEDTARRCRMPRWIAAARNNKARVYLLTGELAKARDAFRGNRDVYVKAGEHLNIIRTDLSVGWLDVLQRHFDRAEARLSDVALRLQEHAGRREQGVWSEYMGDLELSRGRLDQAVVHLQKAIATGMDSGPDESVIGQSRRLLAEARLAQGNIDEAMAECERALVSIRKVGERFEEGVVYRVLGEVHARRGAADEATKAFRHSIEILRTIGARLEWGRSCLAAGRCTLLSNRERLGHLMEAERLFAEVGVPYWIEEADRELAQMSEQSSPRRSPRIGGSRNGRPVFVAEDPRTTDTLRLAERYARNDIAILITGETGTGKDLLARYVHSVSPRCDGPFVNIDLNTVPESLWESELFGHCKGTFTGASAEKVGLLETADGGTVFLNEIGDLSPVLQAKLLELLDTRQTRRLGETQPRALDARFIAATNRDLSEAVDAGSFRADLFFRLEQAPLYLAPLRERGGDIVPLIRHFLAEFDVPAPGLGDLPHQTWVGRALQEPWYGNVRQLRNFLWRLSILVESPTNGEFAQWAERLIDHLHLAAPRGVVLSPADDQPVRLRTVLERNRWNQRAAARELSVSEAGVRHLMRQWDIQRPA